MSPKTRAQAGPSTLALMHKRIEGDDALLALAKHRFEQAGMGAELYADSPGELGQLMRFVPRVQQRTVVHLPRGMDLLAEEARRRVVEFAARGREAVWALVVHDQPEAQSGLKTYVRALRELDRALEAMHDAPHVCVEYAAGLDPSAFLAIFEQTLDLKRIAPCVDIGHVGLARARRVYEADHPGEDVCALHPASSGLQEKMNDIDEAVHEGRLTACKLVGDVAALGKPLHLHLHDAHPLSDVSPWGVSDHLTFLDPIRLPFEHRGGWSADTMFGPEGLRQVVTAACDRGRRDVLSLSLEIHPTEGRHALRDATPLFAHWRDHTNAERMDFWLAVLAQNHQLLRSVCAAVCG